MSCSAQSLGLQQGQTALRIIRERRVLPSGVTPHPVSQSLGPKRGADRGLLRVDARQHRAIAGIHTAGDQTRYPRGDARASSSSVS